MREKGIHIQEGFPCFLTTAHTDADIDQVIRAFQGEHPEMQAGGVLPEPHERTGTADHAADRQAATGDHERSRIPPRPP